MSEIVQLMKQIESECEAMRLALYGYAAVASHEVINQKYDALDIYRAELAKHLGEGEATLVVVEIYTKVLG